MSNQIVLKRSSVAAKAPTTGQLALGELAVNTNDGVIYLLKNNGTPSIVEIGANQFSGDVSGSSSKGSGVLTLANSGVTAGSYDSVTVDNKGRVISGSTTSSNATIKQIITGIINSYSGTTTIQITTAPTITSGTEIWSQDITVTTGTRMFIKSQIFADSSSNNRFITMAIFRDNTLIGLTPVAVSSSGIPTTLSYMGYDTGLTPGTYTYSCRVGINSSTWYVNQNKSAQKYGNGAVNSFSLTEIV